MCVCVCVCVCACTREGEWALKLHGHALTATRALDLVDRYVETVNATSGKYVAVKAHESAAAKKKKQVSDERQNHIVREGPSVYGPGLRWGDEKKDKFKRGSVGADAMKRSKRSNVDADIDGAQRNRQAAGKQRRVSVSPNENDDDDDDSDSDSSIAISTSPPETKFTTSSMLSLSRSASQQIEESKSAARGRGGKGIKAASADTKFISPFSAVNLPPGLVELAKAEQEERHHQNELLEKIVLSSQGAVKKFPGVKGLTTEELCTLIESSTDPLPQQMASVPDALREMQVTGDQFADGTAQIEHLHEFSAKKFHAAVFERLLDKQQVVLAGADGAGPAEILS